MIKLARTWKVLCAAERAALGERGMGALLDRAPEITLHAGGALVFPHTYLRGAGQFVAGVARAVVRSGCSDVIALGVLHNAREVDAISWRVRRGLFPQATPFSLTR